MATLTPTLKDTLRDASLLLRHAGCGSFRLDAEVLWMHVSGQSKTDIIIHAYEPVPANHYATYMRAINRRQQREPVAYITGEKEFWSRSFAVNSDVLIPRPETEHTIEWVQTHYPESSRPWYFADVGTGSGCIAITLACEYPQAHILACDISASAIRTAEANAIRHGVNERIHFIVADLLSACSKHQPFDAIVSNPPYVSAEEMQQLAPELSHEPQHALTDHADGLQCMRILLEQASPLLKTGGKLCVETGPCGYIKAPTYPMQLDSTYCDLAGHVRGAIYGVKVSST